MLFSRVALEIGEVSRERKMEELEKETPSWEFRSKKGTRQRQQLC